MGGMDMSYKVRNEKLAGLEVGISTERVKFDENGIGEIQSKELYDEVIKLPNYFPVEEAKAERVEKAEEPKEEAKEEAKPKATKSTKAASKK
jgi:hypothetical protein